MAASKRKFGCLGMAVESPRVLTGPDCLLSPPEAQQCALERLKIQSTPVKFDCVTLFLKPQDKSPIVVGKVEQQLVRYRLMLLEIWGEMQKVVNGHCWVRPKG